MAIMVLQKISSSLFLVAILCLHNGSINKKMSYIKPNYYVNTLDFVKRKKQALTQHDHVCYVLLQTFWIKTVATIFNTYRENLLLIHRRSCTHWFNHTQICLIVCQWLNLVITFWKYILWYFNNGLQWILKLWVII